MTGSDLPSRAGDDRERQAVLGVAVLTKAYSDAATANMLEAEELICRAMELREQARMLFDRALRLAAGHAAKYPMVQMLPPEEPIDW